MSDILFKYSQIGGGKSFHSVIELCQELETTDRYIVTNLSVLLDDVPKEGDYWTLQEYCQRYCDKPVDVHARVAWLTKAQAVEFYRYLPAAGLSAADIEKFNLEIIENVFEQNGKVLTRSRVAKLPLRDDAVHGKLVDFSARNHTTGCFRHGVRAWIDEAHKLYSARQYHKVSPLLEDYQSELRKLDDDLTLITQNPEKVDKNCRRNATGWVQVQNMSKNRLLMGVTLDNKFRYHWYNQSEMPGRLDKPTVSGWYSFDAKRRYHQLYLTMEGVGVSGGLMKETNRVKGAHWSVWIIGLLLVCGVCWYAPRVAGMAIKKVVAHGTEGMVSGVRDVVAPPIATRSTEPVRPERPAATVTTTTNAPRPVRGSQVARFEQYRPELTVRQYARVGNDMWVWLSDGRIAKASRKEVESVGENHCRVMGMLLPVSP